MRKEATALSRAKVLRPILEIEEQGFPVSCALEDAAHDLGLSKSHTWRLYRRMKANDARSSALDLQRRGPKKGTRRLSGEVEQIIECGLRQYFLVRERPSLSDVNACGTDFRFSIRRISGSSQPSRSEDEQEIRNQQSLG